MAFNISNPIGTGTDQELLEFTRAAIARITLQGVAYTDGGRQLTLADLPDLREQLRWLESRINTASSSRSNKSNLASFKRAT